MDGSGRGTGPYLEINRGRPHPRCRSTLPAWMWGSTALTFTAHLSQPAEFDVVVAYDTEGGTATAGNFTFARSRLTLGTQDDNTDEPASTLTLTLTDGANYGLGAATTATVTVDDNDGMQEGIYVVHVVTVAADTDTVIEGETAAFTLTRTNTDIEEPRVVNITIEHFGSVLAEDAPT